MLDRLTKLLESVVFRKGPNGSEQVPKRQNTYENFQKVEKNREKNVSENMLAINIDF